MQEDVEEGRRFQQQGLEGLVVVQGPSGQVATQVEEASELLVDELMAARVEWRQEEYLLQRLVETSSPSYWSVW